MPHPWYSWYPGDYAADTPDLSCEEHGCYRLLLDASWKVGPLPDDLNRLSRLAAGCPPQTVRYILERYWVRSENGWTNNRLEVERDKAMGYSDRQRQAALKRWQPDAAAYATALPEHVPRHMPLQCPRARSTTTTTEEKETSLRSAKKVPASPSAPRNPQAQGTRLPADWTLPEEWRAWAEAHGLNGRVSMEAERFRDYWHACAGAKARKADWQATWRNWVRKAAEDTARKPALQRPSTDAGWRELAAQYGIRVRTQTYTQLWDEILAAARANS